MSRTLTALSSRSSVSSPHLNSRQVMQGGVVLQSSVSYPLPPPRTTSLVSHQLMTTARDQSSASDPPHQMRSARATMRKHQVWSLTQFYSVDFSKSRISVKSAFSTNAQSRFGSVVVDGVLEPPHRLALVPEATHEGSRKPLKGAVSAQKAF